MVSFLFLWKILETALLHEKTSLASTISLVFGVSNAAILCNETLGIPPPDMCFSAVTRVIQRTGEVRFSIFSLQSKISLFLFVFLFVFFCLFVFFVFFLHSLFRLK